MENIRVKTVELQIGNKKESFEISHAERILSMTNNGGWKLPSDSKYTFDKNGITVKRYKRPSKKSN